MTVRDDVWVIVPLVAVTITAYAPGVDPVQDSVAVAESVSMALDGVSEQYRPLGETSTARLTVPENWFRLMREIRELDVDPVFKLRVVESAFMAKFRTV